jgi:hypothetical protein
MDLNKNFIKNKVLLKKSTLNNAYYINVFLTKTSELFEYVDVKKDEKIFKIERQKINPYYIDYGFFNSVNRIKTNKYEDLSVAKIDYLNKKYKDSIDKYGNGNVETWFNKVGYNILVNTIIVTINKETGEETREIELDILEKLDSNIGSVISKAYYFPISINK